MRFFHRKHECYIVAAGSFAGKFASLEVIRDQMRILSSKRRRRSSDHEMSLHSDNVDSVDTPLETQIQTVHQQTVLVEVHNQDLDETEHSQPDVAVHPGIEHEMDTSKMVRGISFEGTLNDGVTHHSSTALDRLASDNLNSLSNIDNERAHVVSCDGENISYYCIVPEYILTLKCDIFFTDT